ncbi:ABC transporter ATP-binding protein [Enterococcus quebecensis]|uniref:ABC transporter permease n=1 Tax=Enterococcus quebecensis TaxID=903983 RepID=A0A1E5GUB5_9ENTE|nr:ABC transporter ATP-binding protein [Enterococcus quebecensis]OEG16255.1 hypothetical protein BCR23_05040 [Enterococcus quebecensis]OJG74471.1 hypothetical protein RV12_GL002528 [Enterococcus quebecensis]
MKRYLLQNPIISSITILLVVLSSLATVYVAILLQQVIDLATKNDFSEFTKVITTTIIYFILLGILKYTSSLFSKKLIRQITQNMRKDAFFGIMNKSISKFTEVNSGDYLSLLSNDIKLIEENYLNPMLLILSNIAAFIGTLVLILFYSPLIAVYLFIALLLMFVVPGLIGKSLQRKQNNLIKQYASFTKKIKDYFSGFEVINSYNMKDYIKESFQKENTKLATSKYDADRFIALNESISDILATVSMLSVIFIAAYLVLIGNITVGTLVALIQLSSFFVNPVMIIMQNFPKISGTKTILDRLKEHAKESQLPINESFDKNISFNNELLVNNLSFSYKPEKNVLNNISLSFKKGKKYAIVGPSGCGKSTLIKIISGSYSDYSGDIFYDDLNLKMIENSCLNNIVSVLHQNVYLFDASFYFNICLHNNYSYESFNSSLYFSGLEEFIQENTIDTTDYHFPVGENGTNLSGGQKQRIAFARSVIREPQILILDEGTSSLDIKTSRDIETKLLSLRGTTVISITHKINEEVLNKYDEVIYIENGKVIEQGSFDNLITKSGLFSKFYNSQYAT